MMVDWRTVTEIEMSRITVLTHTVTVLSVDQMEILDWADFRRLLVDGEAFPGEIVVMTDVETGEDIVFIRIPDKPVPRGVKIIKDVERPREIHT